RQSTSEENDGVGQTRSINARRQDLRTSTRFIGSFAVLRLQGYRRLGSPTARATEAGPKREARPYNAPDKISNNTLPHWPVQAVTNPVTSNADNAIEIN